MKNNRTNSKKPITQSRREFIKKGVLICCIPTIIKASTLGFNGTVPANSRLNMGRIGVGGQGTRQMAGGIWSPGGGFIAQPSIKVVAVCDPNKNNVERAKNIVNQRYGNNDCMIYCDFRELLARKDIDVVLIATGERWHP